ncbi:MAG TPA: amino acid adenylation domain-containing protein [Pyrinomonadaceae bacterium]
MSSSINQHKGTLPERITNLSPEKRELLERLLRQKGMAAPADAAIAPRERSARPPLSFAQQRLWVLHQLDPANASYNMPEAVRLTGPLKAETLELSLNEVLRRHEVLRTTFETTADGPVQVIAPTLALELPLLDLSELPAREREAETRRLAAEEAARPFDLARGPVLRAALLRLAPEEHVLLFNVHHIASDVWSMGVLVREVMALYNAFSRGAASPLPELPIQYADFAVWQRRRLRGAELEKQLSYWRRQLADAPAVLELPTDRVRPAVQSSRGASLSFGLTRELSASLLQLARQENCTPFMLLLAAFNTLLHRYTGQADIVVGTPMAGRNRSETEGLIGFFVNTLVLRTDLSGDPSFRQLLTRVREASLGAAAHQDLPFEKLVEELAPERDLSRSPLFQVMFALQNVKLESPALSELQLTHAGEAPQIAKFDLTLFMSESDGELGGSLEYNTDLFDAASIERMAAHFEQLLMSVAADPDRRVSALEILPAGEREALLVKYNETATAYPRGVCAHELFERQAVETPDAVAVSFKDERLTYAELNQRANQLARRLRGMGVGPDVLVGVLVERSPEMPVALLGVLKAGGAYLPLDASQPRERLALVLSDARVRVLVTQESFREVLSGHDDVRLVCLDSERDALDGLDAENLAPLARPENLAYVIYTSGSTGVPKGAMIPHQGLVNYLSWCVGAYAVSEGQGAPVHSPIGFDLTVTSLFAPLLAGRETRLLPEDEGVEGLGRALREGHDFSLVKITPAHLEVLRHLVPSEVAAGRTNSFIIGGEALLGEHISFWRQHAPATRLINEYGPTETVVGCCVYEVPRGATYTGAVPIGRPIANTRLYVLDRHMRPVPTMVSGELYIGGDGLARGYLNRPTATADKFVPDPFSTEPGARLYRTGDLCRFLPDGEMEYLGRIDHQVKIRGFRIELGEVETALGRHPSVREAVAAVREDVPGDKRLVAYVVAEPGRLPTLGELRRDLKDRLPGYMMPSALVVLDELPLTPNGKVDQRRLPAPAGAGTRDRETYIAPRNLTELALVEIWEEVLNYRPVGVNDDFFDLGGHSVLALRVVAQIEKLYGLDLPLSTFFEGGTVEHFATLIRLRAQTKQTHLVRLQAGGTGRPIFFMHPIGGGIVCYAYLARHLGAERPVYALAALEVDDPHESLEQMAVAYIEEMRGVQPHGPYLLSGWSFGAFLALEVARQLRALGEEVGLLAALDSEAPGLQDLWERGETGDEEDPVMLVRQLEIFANRVGSLKVDEEYLRQLGRDEQLLYIMDVAKEAHVMPRELNLTQVKRSLRNVKTRIRAGQVYNPPAYDGKVTLFRCERVIPLFQAYLEADPTWGWGRISSEPVEIHHVPGSHETMVVEPDVQALAHKLKLCIANLETE